LVLKIGKLLLQATSFDAKDGALSSILKKKRIRGIIYGSGRGAIYPSPNAAALAK
jgi:hypothetical protein